MKLEGKKIVVLGMGITGVAAALFLGKHGAKVKAVDEKPFAQWGAAFERIQHEPWLERCSYNEEVLDGADFVVPSPGVPPRNNLLQAALKRKIAIISEVELAFRFLKAPLIAVTGTNGKTTTTTLLGGILKKAGKKTLVGGNIGNPLIGCVEDSNGADFVVAEISSFQLQWTDKFRPYISILLNVTSDHMDYHGSFEEYLRVKKLIFANQKKEDYAVVRAMELSRYGLKKQVSAKITAFSYGEELEEGIFVKGDKIVFRTAEKEEEIYPLDIIRLPGIHNVENVMAAVVAARICGCAEESIKTAVAEFHGLAHRIEFVAEKNNVKFYDDSKGTNVGSVASALSAFSGPVILLMGGRDKEGNFEELRPLILAKAKQVILFGEAQNRIAKLIGNNIPKLNRPKLRDAIEAAFEIAQPGDVVLLSPGCASFDEFRDYKERGDYFKKIVRSN
ncbi:MAG TPA: UDP-N-acetylmuramoyl-L-alanine--D-glutamate ligase [Deltaproteobacteria bacterium]|nr:UDP-N-acetylmuramoyl-L-alanine--D-glutamate ligase [Deltaproteobacteria bacterium]